MSELTIIVILTPVKHLFKLLPCWEMFLINNVFKCFINVHSYTEV